MYNNYIFNNTLTSFDLQGKIYRYCIFIYFNEFG